MSSSNVAHGAKPRKTRLPRPTKSEKSPRCRHDRSHGAADQGRQGSGWPSQGDAHAYRARRKAENEAAAQKRKAEEKSSGFFGWLASKAKAFFDGIKKGIQKAFEKARKRVKAAIEAGQEARPGGHREGALGHRRRHQARWAPRSIAIGDKLLADFPGLRKIVQTRNMKVPVTRRRSGREPRSADSLKTGCTEGSRRCSGRALDAALGLLEKGLLAAGRCLFAPLSRGRIEVGPGARRRPRGMFVVLIKDIAAGPGQVDLQPRVRGHGRASRTISWPAFKTAVNAVVQSKGRGGAGLGSRALGHLLTSRAASRWPRSARWPGRRSRPRSRATLIQLLVEKLIVDDRARRGRRHGRHRRTPGRLGLGTTDHRRGRRLHGLPEVRSSRAPPDRPFARPWRPAPWWSSTLSPTGCCAS